MATVFRPLVQAAEKARAEIQSIFNRIQPPATAKGGGGGLGPYRSLVTQAERASDQIERNETRAANRRASRQEAAERNFARIRERHFQDQQRKEEQAEVAAAKARAARVKSIASGAATTLGGMAKGALGIAGAVASGLGIKFDIGTLVGKGAALQTRATELSASAYVEGQSRRDPRAIIDTARRVANVAAFDPEQALEGLQAFVGKTGDLKTGEAALEGLARLSRATGTNLNDMVDAAGDAANALGDVGPGKAFATNEAKAAALLATMRQIAGQGKVGAVEIKNLATQMAKLGAASTAFSGDAGKNLQFMGALAQMARAGGGASSATQAATAVAGFVNTLKTPARMKAFKAAGVETINEKTGQMLDPETIILNAIKAKGADVAGFKELFANVQGARAVEPAVAKFREVRAAELAKGTPEEKAAEAGLAAVKELFAKFKTSISGEEEAESFKRSMDTTAAKAQLFQNRLQELADRSAARVLPALERLAPVAEKVVASFANVVAWAAENPGAAVASAIGASIAKAAIGNVVQNSIQKLLEGAAGKGGGKLALALGAASIAISTATIVASYLNEQKRAAGEKATSEIGTTEEVLGAAEKKFKETGALSPEDIEALKKRREVIMEQQKEAAGYEKGRYEGEGVLGRIAAGAAQAYDVTRGKTTFEQIGRGQALQAQAGTLATEGKAIDALIRALEANTAAQKAGGAPGGPGVDQSGRTK